ncbi:MAG TPA: Rieske (2Fe-2S) protein [Pseudonocardia sp.]|jgi:3-phenylpropionate/trans-cinnamate dioxygenase ferredoxin subunit|nr:Rieske (2Fe-2S) protein [Pseudonocardia sp.]
MGAARAHVVGRAEDIPPGSSLIVDIDGRSIGVFNIRGSYYAIRNTCPHASGPLCAGSRSGLVLSREPGQYDYIRPGEFIRCPWHQWEFDITTGQSWVDPTRTRVRSYEAQVQSGADLLDSESELTDAGFAKGPYTAETYPVNRDGDYVVIRM